VKNNDRITTLPYKQSISVEKTVHCICSRVHKYNLQFDIALPVQTFHSKCGF